MHSIKSNIVCIFCILNCLNFFVIAQSDLSAKSNLYLGIKGGFSTRTMEESNYLFSYSGLFLYNWNNNFLSFSYTGHSGLYLKFDENNADHHNTTYKRFEGNFGKVFRLAEEHKLFRRLCITISAGVGYNIFNFFEKELASPNFISKKDNLFSFLIGLGFTSNIGKLFYAGIEIRQNIVQNLKPHGELNIFVMVNIL